MKKVKVKKYSLIEVIIMIMVIPILFGIITNTFISGTWMANMTLLNNRQLNILDIGLNQMSCDLELAHQVIVEENTLTLYVNTDTIQYVKTENELYRNDIKIMDLKKIILDWEESTPSLNQEKKLIHLSIGYQKQVDRKNVTWVYFDKTLYTNQDL